jgi:polyisoprenoid-binding protein YceI
MLKSSSTTRGRRRAVGGAAALVLLAATGVAAEGPSWRLERGEGKILVPLKPGGAFAATTSSLSGTLTLEGAKPARLAGEVSMDLSTIDTGIALRNQHLREKYLEVAKGDGFNKAVLSEIQLAAATGETFDGTTPFTGALLLHGVKRPVAGTAEIHSEGTSRRVRAEFPLELTEWSVVPPEYLGVGVGSKLLVKVNVIAAPVRPPAP